MLVGAGAGGEGSGHTLGNNHGDVLNAPAVGAVLVNIPADAILETHRFALPTVVDQTKRAHGEGTCDNHAERTIGAHSTWSSPRSPQPSYPACSAKH